MSEGSPEQKAAETRRLAAIMFTDIVGFSHQMGADETRMLRVLALHNQIIEQAVALDDSLPLAHRLLGWVSVWKNKEYEQGIGEAERAIALDPNDAEGYMTLGNMLVWVGRPKEAIGLVEKAMRLNPHYLVPYLTTLGMAYRLTGQYEEAIAVLQRAIARSPHYVPSYVHLAVIYSELGREEEARAEIAEVLRRNPQYSLEGARRANPYKDPAVIERYLAGLRQVGLK